MRFATRMERVQPSAIRELLRLGDDPTITSFGGGYPDPATFPVTALREAYEQVLTTSARTALQYTATVGLPQLRAQVAARLTADGAPTGSDDVLILQGAQQGLDFVAKLLLDPVTSSSPTTRRSSARSSRSTRTSRATSACPVTTRAWTPRRWSPSCPAAPGPGSSTSSRISRTRPARR